MWNDTDTPLAFFISFRCYGTWLHGDERKSIDRHNNVYGTLKIPPAPHWNEISKQRSKYRPVSLDTARRSSVERQLEKLVKKEAGRFLQLTYEPTMCIS
jgi:hypothetical protein